MALVRAMDVTLEQWREQSHHSSSSRGSGGQQQGAAALEASMVPASTTYFASDAPLPLPPHHQRAGTPCPAALREDRRGASFVLLPDGAGFANRRFIELGAGTTVVSGVERRPFAFAGEGGGAGVAHGARARAGCSRKGASCLPHAFAEGCSLGAGTTVFVWAH